LLLVWSRAVDRPTVGEAVAVVAEEAEDEDEAVVAGEAGVVAADVVPANGSR